MTPAHGPHANATRSTTSAPLATAVPVGVHASVDDAFAGFIDRCRKFGWRPAVIGARADRIPFYETAGLRARYLGDEAVIDVDEFTLDGRRLRPVRQAFNRTKNFALTAEIHRVGELDPTLRRAVVGISDRHLGVDR